MRVHVREEGMRTHPTSRSQGNLPETAVIERRLLLKAQIQRPRTRKLYRAWELS